MEKNKELIILAGVNGSDKYIIADTLLEVCKMDFMNANNIAFQLVSNNILFAVLNIIKLAIKKIYKNIESGISFLWEIILSGNFAKKIIKKAKLNRYNIKMLYVFLDCSDDHTERVKVRVFKGGHYISSEDIIRRYTRNILNFIKYKEIVDFLNLYYNNIDKIQIVAEKDNVMNNDLYCKFFGKKWIK